MKDNFSVQSDDYVKFRPQYTQELIDYLVSITSKRNSCWDCGTGNGQLAVALSTYFENVKATDISENQLKNAIEVPNVEYSLQPAEETTFPDKTFDLITVAQAAHWFDHGKFNKEVKRLLTADGVIALFGYGLVQVDDELDPLIRSFYWNVTRPFWDPERDHIEARYKTIPFPYHELEVGDNFDIKRDMTLEELTGYIGTWSAV
ncbi:MAG: class I SAM-dependent methyltransferase, partial [Ekhidna sp.]|nr:class I SAM-dependent methyltransferase [Ekhidna sp.]